MVVTAVKKALDKLYVLGQDALILDLAALALHTDAQISRLIQNQVIAPKPLVLPPPQTNATGKVVQPRRRLPLGV
jgi:hypothetical protein